MLSVCPLAVASYRNCFGRLPTRNCRAFFVSLLALLTAANWIPKPILRDANRKPKKRLTLSWHLKIHHDKHKIELQTSKSQMGMVLDCHFKCSGVNPIFRISSGSDHWSI